MQTPALDRRTFLKASLAAAAASAAGPVLFDRSAAWAAASAAAADGVFGYGVASGDPLGTAVVLWTRVTPTPDAVPGSGVGAPVTLSWELAADEAFKRVVKRGSVGTTAARDHTVKVDVTGLAPYTRYFYRFTALGSTSPTGRTQTAPDIADTVTALRMGVVSCSNYTGGYFTSYRAMGERDDLDLVLHLGDYVYEYGNGADRYGPEDLIGKRDHQPATEMVSLSDYRLRFACYRADQDLALAHRRHPWIVVLDDHEVANDTYREGAENHQPATEGTFSLRKTRATQAYLEWMPIREPLPGRQVFYRRFSFGPTADLHVIETRTFRDQQVTNTTQDQRDDPAREFLGPDQRKWLFDGLTAGKGQHQWRILGNQTVLAPVEIPPLPAALASLPSAVPGSPLPGPGLAFNADQWDGYEAERNRLKALVVDEELKDVVVLTGDIHSSWANDIPLDEGTYEPLGPLNNSIMTEFVTTSITSDNVDEIAGDPGGPAGMAAARGLENAFKTTNRHIRFLDFEKHGYGVLDLTPERAQFDWFWIRSESETDPRVDPDAEVYYGTSWQTLAGTQQVSQADGPVGKRADSPRVLAAATPAAATPTATPSATPTSATGSGSTGTGSTGSGSTGSGSTSSGLSSTPTTSGSSLPSTGPDGPLPALATLLAGGALALRRRRPEQEPDTR